MQLPTPLKLLSAAFAAVGPDRPARVGAATGRGPCCGTGEARRVPASATIAGAWTLLAGAVAAPTFAQGFDDRFPDPITSAELVAWLGPLLATSDDGWPRALEVHRRYLDEQRALRADAIEAWLVREERLQREGEAGDDQPKREELRRRLVARIEASDALLFDGIAAVVDHQAAPGVAAVLDWLKVHRALATCECGLDVQTQEVSFSLLSYSDEALESPPLVWTSPQAAVALAEYDRRILRWGRDYLKAHRAWEAAQLEAADQAEARSGGTSGLVLSGLPIVGERFTLSFDGQDVQLEGNVVVRLASQAGLSDGPPSSGDMPPEFDELMDSLRAERIEFVQQHGDDGEWEEAEDGGGEAAWSAHGRALAYLGRRMHGQIEAAMDARTRLLFRLRILNQVVDLGDPAAGEEGRRSRESPDSLRRALREMEGVLERIMLGELSSSVDVGALERLCAAHWTLASGMADELLKVSRRRSDVMFFGGAEIEERAREAMERRRVELVRQWQPLAIEALGAMRAIEAQANAIAQAAQPQRRRGAAARGPRAELLERLGPLLAKRLGPGDEARDGRAQADHERSGAFDARRYDRLMASYVPGPIWTEEILRALGWLAAPIPDVQGDPEAAEAEAAEAVAAEAVQGDQPPTGDAATEERDATRGVIEVLRSEVLSRAWVDLDALLLLEDEERSERGLAPLSVPQKVDALVAIRDLVRGAEERLVGEVAAIVPGEAERLRLRLLLHSLRFQRSHWPWDDLPGLDDPCLRPIDVAGLVLGELATIHDAGEARALAQAFFDLGDPLLIAAAATGEAYVAAGRALVEARASGEEEGDQRTRERAQKRLSSAQSQLAALLMAEIRLQWDVIERLCALRPEAQARWMRRVALHACTTSRLFDGSPAEMGTETREALRSAEDDEGAIAMMDLVEEARLRHLDGLIEVHRQAALRHGVLFPRHGEGDWADSSELWRIQRRLRFDAAELETATQLAVASIEAQQAGGREVQQAGGREAHSAGPIGVAGRKVGLSALLAGIDWADIDGENESPP